MKRVFWRVAPIAAVVLFIWPEPAAFGESAPASVSKNTDWFEAVSEEASSAAKAEANAAAPPAKEEWTKPIPLSFSLNFVLVSDYIWRGLNFSEYPGEGRERPNYQPCATIEYDTGNFGVFGASFWFEWYAAQHELTPWDDNDLQEVDYTVYWRYPITSIGVTFETGWIAYTFPPYNRSGAKAAGFSHDLSTDYDWYLKLSFDDSKWFKTEKAVLNPYVAYYQNLDLAAGASWWEVGVSHGFALADLGAQDVPILKDITLTPSLVLGMSHRYYGEAGYADSSYTRLANLLYGLDLTYDLSSALKIPAKYGKLTTGGFINFSQALDREVLDDQFFGGFKIGYSW